MMFHFLFIHLIVTPHTRCRLRMLKLERIKDFLLMEEEFIQNQERLKPQEEKNLVCTCTHYTVYNTNTDIHLIIYVHVHLHVILFVTCGTLKYSLFSHFVQEANEICS